MTERLYVAGPMTGLPDHNIAAFNRAELVLRAIGYRVLNPARHEGKADTWEGYMRLGIKDVCESDGVALLPGWEDSQGAVLEKSIAESLSMPAKPIDQWLWADPTVADDVVAARSCV